MVLNRKNSGVNGAEPEKKLRLTGEIAASTALNRRKAALAALSWRNGVGNCVEPEK